MDYRFWVPAGGTIAQIILGLWAVMLQRQALQEVQTRSEKRRGAKLPWYRLYWPMFAMAACMVGTWVPYLLSPAASPASGQYLEAWGPAPTPGYIPKPGEVITLTYTKVLANGHLLASEKSILGWPPCAFIILEQVIQTI